MVGQESSVHSDTAASGGRPRPGPRPLPLYLTTAAATWLSSYASSAAWKSGSLDWNPGSSEAATSLREQLAALDAARAAEADRDGAGSAIPSFEQAIDEEARRRMGRFLDGVQAYRAHPYRRPVIDPPVCWKEGTTRLLDYGAVPEAAVPSGGAPILVVPSLVNRGYVLDLAPERSLLRALAAAGFRPFLVEWGFPGEAERRFTLTDYVAGRLEGALEAVLTISGRRPAVLGYCMGGLLALALVQRRPRDTGALALLATPWDFAADAPPIAASLPLAQPWLTAMIEQAGWLPTDLIQTLFFALDPMLVIRKFLRFVDLDAASPGGAGVRRARGLAERRRAAGRAGGARGAVRLVRPQHPGCRRLADRRAPGRAGAGRSPRHGDDPGARPHRAAGVGAGAGRPAAQRHARRRGAGPHRHGGRRRRAAPGL